MSACNLSNKDLDYFQKLIDDPAFRRKGTLQEKRSLAMSTPLPWSKAKVQQLSHYPAPQKPHPEMPKWARA
eukprot:10495027-Lingulodinium_polyedra.AAC.1